MNINNLTPEQLELLKAQIAESEKAKKEKKEKERETYKQLVNNTVPDVFEHLKNVSQYLASAKNKAFADMQTLVDMKYELFKVKETQQSHTFTTDDNRYSIKLGYRIVDGWDDTVNSGVAKVKEYLKSLAKDAETASLVDIILGLLKPDSKGDLKASRVLELRKHAERLKNDDLTDAVDIINKAYKPKRTCSFVEAVWQDENGKEHSLPLSMSSVPLETLISILP